MTPRQQDSHGGQGRDRGSALVAARTTAETAASGVAERFRAARRAGHPTWLWPEIPVGEWRAALVELERITTALLAGGSVDHAPAAQPAAFGLALYTSGLGPWLGRHSEDGRFAGDDGAAALVREHLEHSRRRALRVAAELGALLDALAGAGIRATVLKGGHTASAYFAEPALRPMSDVDVLVDRDSVQAAEHVLAVQGYVESAAQRLATPYRTEWRPASASPLPHSLMLMHADDACAIDLHGTLDIDFFGVRTVRFGAPTPALLAHTRLFGAPATVLRQPLLAAHLAVHASHGLHGLTLIRLVELALVLRADMRTDADWQQLAEQLRVLDAERFAFPALALLDRLVPDLLPPGLLARIRSAAPPRLRAVIDELRPGTAQRIDVLALDERFMWAATPREHLRRLGNMLLPTGVNGPLRRLGRIYAERAFRIVRRRVSLHGARNAEG